MHSFWIPHIHTICAEIHIRLILMTYGVGTLLIGNDARYKALKSGTIKIRTFNVIVRTLSEIAHVTDLKENLNFFSYF